MFNCYFPQQFGNEDKIHLAIPKLDGSAEGLVAHNSHVRDPQLKNFSFLALHSWNTSQMNYRFPNSRLYYLVSIGDASSKIPSGSH